MAVSQSDARTACESYGAVLTSVESQDELDYLVNISYVYFISQYSNTCETATTTTTIGLLLIITITTIRTITITGI